jgi:hypothetical protein
MVVETLDPLPVVPWPTAPRKMTKALAATCVRRFRAGESFASIAESEGLTQEAVEEAVRVAPPPKTKRARIPPDSIGPPRVPRTLRNGGLG